VSGNTVSDLSLPSPLSGGEWLQSVTHLII
jgi:hypothetical protein